jgi:hypothetical protein
MTEATLCDLRPFWGDLSLALGMTNFGSAGELVHIVGRELQKFGCNLSRSLYPSGPVHG